MQRILRTWDARFRKDALQFEGSRLERVRLCFDLYSDVKELAGGAVL